MNKATLIKKLRSLNINCQIVGLKMLLKAFTAIGDIKPSDGFSDHKGISKKVVRTLKEALIKKKS